MRTSEPDFEPGTLNAYCVSPAEVQPGDRYGYKIVVRLDEGYPGWAAYRGPTGWSDQHVMDNGDVIPETIAAQLFPSLAATGRAYQL